MATKKTTITSTYCGPIEAMHGVVMEVPASVPNPAAWMESVWREEQAAQAAAEEKRQRQQRVLNDRIQKQQEQEKLLPNEQLQQLEQRLKHLEGRKMPSGQDMNEAQGVIMSGQTSLMNAGLQLAEQARLQEKLVTQKADQERAVQKLLEENENLHKRIEMRHASGLNMWNSLQEAAAANIEAEQKRNAELVTQLELQRTLIEKQREQIDELNEINEGWRSSFQKEQEKNRHHLINRRS